MNKKILLFALLLMASVTITKAQNNVGVNTTTPDPSAALDVTSTNKGMLVPRMTEAQKTAIATPATGLLVYQTDATAGFYYYNGTAWVSFSSGATGATDSSQLQKITEDGVTGWRILGRDTAKYGSIGSSAIDLSNSFYNNNILGATGSNSFATGVNTQASGGVSTAMGESTVASGFGSTAIGSFSTASGTASTAFGNYNIASGSGSTAMGVQTIASGDYSSASNRQTRANSYGETAIGTFNDTLLTSDPSNFKNDSNRVFTIGNGFQKDTFLFINGSPILLTLTKPHTAFVVQQNGNVGINRKVATEKLDIVGSIKIEDGTQGAGKVLTSDANGKASWQTAAAGGGATDSSQLQKITEAGNTGWRILGRDSANYGNIGNKAIDLSISEIPSTTYGATGNYSTAMGEFTTASGDYSTAMGSGSTASGNLSIAMGTSAVASGNEAVAIGNEAEATGDNATALGSETNASGDASTAMGYGSNALGSVATAMGENTAATNNAATAMGYQTAATGEYSTAMGNATEAKGESATAMGNGTTASGESSTAMGLNSKASGRSAASIGYNTFAKSGGEVAIGIYNDTLLAFDANTFGSNPLDSNRLFTVGNGDFDNLAPHTAFVIQRNGNVGINQRAPSEKLDIVGSIKIEDGTQGAGKVLTSDANGKASWQTAGGGGASELQKITEGGNTGWRILGRDTAYYGNIGSGAIDLSFNGVIPSTTSGATGLYSVAMGINSTASGQISTAIGQETTASGSFSTAIGVGTNALAYASTAMGHYAAALGDRSIAMGDQAIASAYGSTAMGNSTAATGQFSTAMGVSTRASGWLSTAMGNYTRAQSYGETVIGSYNDTLTSFNSAFWNGDFNRVFTVGAGTAAARKSVFVIEQNGSVKIGPNGSKNKNVFSATQAIGSNGSQKKTITVTHGKTFTGTQVITATVANQPGTTWDDAFSVTIRQISLNSFTAIICRVDGGTNWGQDPVLHYTITEQ
jgi:trimeric autotransporter adhesin